ncbi:glycosyltransferase 87 family protein [Xylanimonas protaetiae]|uniref:DUF2029 domain-containing protein n=1 Tax=Xylanimonas protaetiae TaxID=2509457 RepID=A0A4P6F8X5_9MICO|nr:glycosyltransferase 87 family protein [Xylanimonas protaetiae]QAY69767.1 DUF2029 domain-containing protein [Xylanimonas protaetiae]
MTAETAVVDRTHTSVGDVVLSRWSLAGAFVLVHAWVVFGALSRSGEIYGDVSLYAWWADRGLSTGWWPVLNEAWVYPAAALIPVTLPALGTSGWYAYATVWSVMVVLLNAGALWLLARVGRRGRVAALWWLGFLVVLGPIWLGRLDGVVAPMILVALLLAHRRPAVAAAVATLGAWIKIAPGAVVVALAATSRSVRGFVRTVVVPGAVVSVAVVGLALAGGAGERAWSVFGEQSDRTLQAESVFATWFSVARLWDPSVHVEYNRVIFTYEIGGTSARAVANALDVVLPLAVVLIGLLAFVATRRRPELAQDVLLLSAAATLFALVVFNKVGSPQFIAWLGPAVAAALALAGPATRRLWVAPAAGMLGVGLLTQVLYPLAYGYFLAGETWMVGVAAVRNLAVVVLLVGAVWRLARLALSTAPAPASSPAVPSRLG